MTTGSRTALVTGANRGIGLEVARQLLGQGLRVVLASRDPRRGEVAARSLGAGVVATVALDAGDPDRPQALFRELDAHGIQVDVLVNNAGIHYDTQHRATSAAWAIVEEAMRVNALGPWRLAQAFAPAMAARGWGRIVNVSSEAGSLAGMSCGTPAYSVSKAALNAVTRILAGELRPRGILVNSVCPGWTATDMGGGGRPVAEGARGVVWAATLPDDGPSGGFFRDGKALAW